LKSSTFTKENNTIQFSQTALQSCSWQSIGVGAGKFLGMRGFFAQDFPKLARKSIVLPIFPLHFL